MLRDSDSHDSGFIQIVRDTGDRLLHLANASKDTGYECVIMEGSGTFGMELVLTSVIHINDKLLILINGSYGERIRKIAEIYALNHTVYVSNENKIPDVSEIEMILQNNNDITCLAMVHCETTTGIINPVKDISALCKKYNKTIVVDAMSTFGAYPINITELHIHFLVSSSNSCIQGIPGFSFIIAHREKLKNTRGKSRSLSFGLYHQWKGLESNGQFRFIPPVYAILTFYKALDELEDEGGIEIRAERFAINHEVLIQGMKELGFMPFLDSQNMGYVITSFLYPKHYNFIFDRFSQLLNEKGFIIYPGKISGTNTFRVGNTCAVHSQHAEKILHAIHEVLNEMNISLN